MFEESTLSFDSLSIDRHRCFLLFTDPFSSFRRILFEYLGYYGTNIRQSRKHKCHMFLVVTCDHLITSCWSHPHLMNYKQWDFHSDDKLTQANNSFRKVSYSCFTKLWWWNAAWERFIVSTHFLFKCNAKCTKALICISNDMLLLFAPVLYHHVVLCIKVGGGKFEFITTSEQRGRAICSPVLKKTFWIQAKCKLKLWSVNRACGWTN